VEVPQQSKPSLSSADEIEEPELVRKAQVKSKKLTRKKKTSFPTYSIANEVTSVGDSDDDFI